MIKIITIFLLSLMTLTLSSCEDNNYNITSYKHEVEYNEFKTWEDKFNKILDNNDFLFKETNIINNRYETEYNDNIIEKSDFNSNTNITAKIDIKNKIIENDASSKKNNRLKTNKKESNSESSFKASTINQEYDGKYYSFDKLKKEANPTISFEVLLKDYSANRIMVLLKDMDNYYIDGNIYTGVSVEDDLKNIIQFKFTNNKIIFTAVSKGKISEESKSKIKTRYIKEKLRIIYEIKDLNLNYIDSKDYKIY